RLQNGPGQETLRVSDPKTGTPALLRAWLETFRPILALLAIALEPLTLDQIHALAGTLADRRQVADAVGWLEHFLSRAGGTVRLYHSSFVDFLPEPAPRDHEDTADLYVDRVEEHRRLASLLESRPTLESVWEDAPDAGTMGLRRYARLFYITH